MTNLQAMLDHYDDARQRAEDAGLWYEVRYFTAESTGTPSHWASLGYAASLNSAGIIADALYRARGWWCEVWTCSPVSDPDIASRPRAPVAWRRVAQAPERRYPDLPGRPPSGNVGDVAIRAPARRALRVLRSAPGDGWIERDALIGQAALPCDGDDLDARIDAVAGAINELIGAGYQVAFSREAAGDFYLLVTDEQVAPDRHLLKCEDCGRQTGALWNGRCLDCIERDWHAGE